MSTGSKIISGETEWPENRTGWRQVKRGKTPSLMTTTSYFHSRFFPLLFLPISMVVDKTYRLDVAGGEVAAPDDSPVVHHILVGGGVLVVSGWENRKKQKQKKSWR